MSNISLKRLQKEYENFLKDPSDDFVAAPIKDDLFCWHFTIRGPEGTEFEGGVYHGVIKLPMSYPYKPPNLMFLTPNGRFDINMDICLSMTRYHKEEWQAAWTIRSMLEAIIAFMPIKEDHEAIGAVDYPTEVRKAFAKNSVNFKCEECGLVSKLLHEKKKKEEVISTTKTEKEKENPITTNEQSNTSKKEKEKKVNFQEYFKQLHENEKKPKEEIDCVEEEEIHITSFPEKKEKVFIGLNSSRDFDRESSFTSKKEEPLINTSHNLETLESKITEIKKEEETIPQKKENKEIKEEKVNDIKVEKDEDKENKDSSDESTFDGFFNEDIEFNFVRKSIKCHFDQSKEDIEKQVKLDENLKKITMQPVQQHIPESIKEKVPSKATTEDTIKNEKDIKVLKELLNKEKTIIKYYSRIQYQKTQGESLKKFNIVMGIIIASVTLIYILIRLIMKN